MIECPREQEVVQAIVAGSDMPAMPVMPVINDGLRAHISVCEACAEVAMLASALRDEERAACSLAALPAAGTVWWRSTIRARAQAAHTAGEPITAFQSIAAAAVLGLVAGLGGLVWRSLSTIGRFTDLVDTLQSRRSDITAASALVFGHWGHGGHGAHGFPLLLALTACLIVAPLAVYFATADE